MHCQTIKQDVDCFFMSKQGCTFNGGSCHPIVEPCHGCDRIQKFDHGVYCQCSPDPAIKWRNGSCNLATHRKSASQKVVKINPLKASKRSKGK